MAELQKDLRQIPPSFGRFAGVDAIDSIKQAYYDLEKSNVEAPSLSLPAPIGMPAPVASPQMEEAPAAAPPAAAAELTPDQVPDEEIARAFDDPHERFAAFVAKYGPELPPELDRHFSALDMMVMKG